MRERTGNEKTSKKILLPLRKDCHTQVPFSFSLVVCVIKQKERVRNKESEAKKKERKGLIFPRGGKRHNGTSQVLSLSLFPSD
jgi:hypothetical protein